MPARTSCSSESRFHRGSGWGMQYLEPSPQLWHLTCLRGNLPSTFSVEAGALPSWTQHRSQPVSRNAKFASYVLLFIQGSTIGISGMIMSTTVRAFATYFPLQPFHSFFCNNGNHDEARHRVGPPQTKQRVQKQASKKDPRKISAELRLLRICVHCCAP